MAAPARNRELRPMYNTLLSCFACTTSRAGGQMALAQGSALLQDRQAQLQLPQTVVRVHRIIRSGQHPAPLQSGQHYPLADPSMSS